MTKEIISKIDFDFKIMSEIRRKAIDTGFIFTMIDTWGGNKREWYLRSNQMYEVSNTAWEEVSPDSLKEWEDLKESFREEVIKELSEKYEVQKFDKYGMPIKA